MMELRDMTEEMAVVVKEAYKRYSPHNVILRGLNMNVREGTIYALLGPSGCGKTTLLRSVMGRSDLDSGEIYVKAKKLCNVGYMPQELALYNNMTIAETFNFYGQLFEMSADKITSRGIDLLKFLDLPKQSRLVGSLSGGQQRRVSLAVALIHDPQLFILDEPTVGVDPVLSHSIWQRLLEMTEMYKKTIIITTHYIEEARQAHTIGLMRSGILLAEEGPLELMHQQNCATLEEVFLKLSRKQEDSGETSDNKRLSIKYPHADKTPPRPITAGSFWSTKRFMAQLFKNVVFHIRNTPMLLFIMCLPAMQVYLVNTAIGHEPKNLMMGIISKELPNGFSDCNFHPNLTCSENGRPYSCRYMDQLRKSTLILHEFHNVDDGLNAIKQGRVWGLVHFSENYTRSVIDRIAYGRDAPNDIIEWSNVDIWMDMSNLWIMEVLKINIVFGLVDFLKELFVECGSSPKLADLPFRFGEPVYGDSRPQFFTFVAPGIVITFCFYLPLMFTTGAIMMEKASGLLDRSVTAGMSILEIVTAHSVIQFVILIFQNAIILGYFYVIYDTPMHGSVPLLLLLIFLVEFSGMCYAFMLAVFFEQEKLATYAGVGTIVGLFTMCGVVWPFQGMHWVLKSVIWLAPVQPAVEAYRGIAERSFGLENSTVMSGFLSTVLWTFVFIIAAYNISRRKKIGL